ncbi:MAG: DUF975 family protein [Prevotella sp.]|nr:DUF975 family protein [Prevotella sp.]
MESITSYKNRALESLENIWTAPVLCTLVYYAITCIVSFLTNAKDEPALNGFGLLVYLGLLPLAWAFTVLFLDFIREEHTTVSALFLGYNKPWSPKSFILPLLVNIFTLLWTLLLIIPGFIKAYSYSMAYYVHKDNPEIGCNAAIDESMRLMNGHKWELFMLDLSFIGWFYLCLLTLGIGFLWLVPYVMTAHAHFYEDLVRERGTYANPAI